MKFNALVSSESDKKFSLEIKERDLEELPEGEILIRVNFSSLNYKDALSAVSYTHLTLPTTVQV